MIVGLLHPGETGAAVGRAPQGNGCTVLWASEGRGDATRARAHSFRGVGAADAISPLRAREVAAHFGGEDEWRLAAPELADTFTAAGQPDCFHRAAARMYRS